MNPAAAIGDVRGPAQVFGVHGTTGVSYWKCLSRRLGLSADWEAVEWACLPPGGVSDAHIHTRTEELYFILTGTGRISWDGGSRLVGSGDLIATPLGARHGLVNTGTDFLAWLVVEVSAPAQAAALAGRAVEVESTRKAAPVSLHIVNLRQVGQFDAGTVLDGPIRDVRLLRLSPGERTGLHADGVEYAVFTVAGAGIVVDGDAQIPLAQGVTVTVPPDGRVSVQAADGDGLELFVACLAVHDEVTALR